MPTVVGRIRKTLPSYPPSPFRGENLQTGRGQRTSENDDARADAASDRLSEWLLASDAGELTGAIRRRNASGTRLRMKARRCVCFQAGRTEGLPMDKCPLS